MKLHIFDVPRVFSVGSSADIDIKDCGKIFLDSDEQVTFVSSGGQGYDVVKKSWGYYATPSVNSRLKNEGFKTAIVKNSKNQVYVMLIELNKIDEFITYCEKESQAIEFWLDEIDL